MNRNMKAFVVAGASTLVAENIVDRATHTRKDDNPRLRKEAVVAMLCAGIAVFIKAKVYDKLGADRHASMNPLKRTK